MQSVKQSMDEYIEDLVKDTRQLKSRLETLYNVSEGKKRIYVDREKLDELFHQAESIFRDMESLDGANRILYRNRGKASPKKSVSSKANGRLGGRPPKEIAAKKKRIQELDDKVFVLHDCLNEEERREYDELNYDVIAWENRRRKQILEEKGQENLNN